MDKKKLSLIVGVALSVLAIVTLNLYLRGEKQKSIKQMEDAFMQKYKNLTSVFVAKEDIPKGTSIDSETLDTKIIPSNYVEPQAITSLSKALGLRTAVPIKKGEQITLNKLLSVRQAATRSLAMATPVGKRAITISVDSIMGVGGMILPGDYIDVIALLPTPARGADGTATTQLVNVPVFQNVLVLAVGGMLAVKEEEQDSGWGWGIKKKETEKRAPSPLITLALTPQEASLLSFINEQGRVRLVVRSPADAKIQPVSPASWETLFQYINSLMPAQAASEEPSVSEPKSVEIYRGSQKDSIYLSQ